MLEEYIIVLFVISLIIGIISLIDDLKKNGIDPKKDKKDKSV